jgi:hypothetical protein
MNAQGWAMIWDSLLARVPSGTSLIHSYFDYHQKMMWQKSKVHLLIVRSLILKIKQKRFFMYYNIKNK